MLFDLRVALRGLAKRPGLSGVVVAMLGIGIGAVTAVFSLVRAVVIEPLPYADPERLVVLFDVQATLDRAPMSYPEAVDWNEQERLFSEIAPFFRRRYNLTGEGDPERVLALRAAASLLPTLGLQPALGRGFTASEEVSGGPRVTLVTDGAWRRRYGGASDVLGRTATLDGEPYTVIGVLPPEAVLGETEVDFWLPLGLEEAGAPRGLHFLSVLARLRPGVELATVRREAAAVAARLGEASSSDHGIHIEPLQEEVVAGARPLLVLLAAAAGCILLIACVNVANLLLARATLRDREIAVRKSLGGGRARLVRQLLTESVVLAASGGVAGLLLAWWGIEALSASAPVAARLPRAEGAGVDLAVLGFAAGLSLATSLLFGAAPALRSTSARAAGALRGGGAGRSGGRSSRLTPALVVVEVALSLTLLASAGLVVRSLLAALATDPGFRPGGLVALDLSLPAARYPDAASQEEFFRRLRERIELLPGVDSSAEVSHLPLGGRTTNGGFAIAGREWPEGEAPLADKRLAGPGYFATLGTPVLRGREFTARDRSGAAPVAVINETMARLHFPGEDPIGRRIDFSWHTEGWQEIVGVVGDVRHEGLDRAPQPEIYVPYAQHPAVAEALGRSVVVRVAGAPTAAIPAMREQVFAVDPDQPVGAVHALEELVSGSLGGRRLAATLVGGLGSVALLLAVVGLYAVIAHLVRRQSHDIGVRMAVGATPRAVLGGVIGRGMGLAAVGGVLGVAGGLAAGRLLAAQLYGVGAADPVTFVAVVAVLAVAALAACAVPAATAARVDPVRALRAE